MRVHLRLWHFCDLARTGTEAAFNPEADVGAVRVSGADIMRPLSLEAPGRSVRRHRRCLAILPSEGAMLDLPPAAAPHTGARRGGPGGLRVRTIRPGAVWFGGRPTMNSRSPRTLTGAEKARQRAWRLLAHAEATADPKLRKKLLAEASKPPSSRTRWRRRHGMPHPLTVVDRAAPSDIAVA